VVVRVQPAVDDVLPDGPAMRYEREGVDLVLEVQATARFTVARGRDITVVPCRSASDRNVRGVLLGSVMGALCHQRGLLPLHASAVEIHGRCIAFAGESSIGKSTVAAALGDRGHRIMCDDVCAVTISEDGTPRVWPGPARIKLWPAVAESMGRHTELLEPEIDGLDKLQVALPPGGDQPLPLARIYVIDAHSASGIARQRGGDALRAVFDNTYRRPFSTVMGNHLGEFERAVALLRGTAIFRVARVSPPSEFARRLEEHVSPSAALT
jgi:hypothetical protein